MLLRGLQTYRRSANFLLRAAAHARGVPPLMTINHNSTLLGVRAFSASGSRRDAGEGGGGGSQRHEREEARKRVLRQRNESVALRALAVVMLTLGLSYAFVPLYAAFCQATGYGGTVQRDSNTEEMLRTKDGKPKKRVTVYFNADVSPALPWKFVPSQRSVECETGDTVLAFFRATNKTDKPIVGISTYNVTPMKAGLYFHKIQCFWVQYRTLCAI